MKSTLLSLFALSVATSASAQLVVPFFRNPSVPHSFDRNHDQAPLMDPLGPGPAIPPSGSSPSTDPPVGSGGGGGSVVLSDVMGRDRSITLFAGFIRDIESASLRLEDASRNTTVLAPLNSAVEKLPRKPWEDPKEYDTFGSNAYEGGDGRERAQRNIRRFVEAHLVPVSPWKEGEKVKTVGGDSEVWWEEKDGRKLIQPGGIELVDVAGEVKNGEVWIIKGVLNYA
ncbi:uncharacterized protein C8A04DRAFT_27822 [Dichotomopilus funicola]|uniref:FAS1 domain-containing protein n=1 Tax=Dichotomopilus funicola TaxID=1934379 RepID=A0AAN6ZNF0_9PEZI|nr:hypothetical protein C8A04DRAFT_27822 [Dichotomopilus funicola]